MAVDRAGRALFGAFEADFEVVGPPELLDACAALARRYAAVRDRPDDCRRAPGQA